MRGFTIAVAVAGLAMAPAGCGGSHPTVPDPGAEPPLSYDEWRRIEDPEERYNRHTIRRLPKDAQSKALREHRAAR